MIPLYCTLVRTNREYHIESLETEFMKHTEELKRISLRMTRRLKSLETIRVTDMTMDFKLYKKNSRKDMTERGRNIYISDM